MKARILLSVALLSLCAIDLQAVLPPLYSTSDEIKAILNDKRIEVLSSGQAIEKIEHNDEGYLITTPKFTLQVNVVYQPQAMPGPARYALEFKKPTSR